MKTQTLREFVEWSSDKIGRIFDRTGVIHPMWHYIDRKGNHCISPAPATDKNTAVAIMRAAFELEGVTRCLFVDEAWTLHVQGHEGAAEAMAWRKTHDNRIDTHPNSVEVVMIMGEDAHEGMITAQRVIDRSGSKPKLGPLQINDLVGWQSSGRMIGMLPRKGKLQ